MEEERKSNEVARRCSICGISWPPQFGMCYQCGGETDRYRGTPTISAEEAQSIMNRYKFNRYLEQTGRHDLLEEN